MITLLLLWCLLTEADAMFPVEDDEVTEEDDEPSLAAALLSLSNLDLS